MNDATTEKKLAKGRHATLELSMNMMNDDEVQDASRWPAAFSIINAPAHVRVHGPLTGPLHRPYNIIVYT